jgi:WD40 repeat protein
MVKELYTIPLKVAYTVVKSEVFLHLVIALLNITLVMTFSPDGEVLIIVEDTGGINDSVRCHSLNTKTLSRDIFTCTRTTRYVSFCPDKPFVSVGTLVYDYIKGGVAMYRRDANDRFYYFPDRIHMAILWENGTFHVLGRGGKIIYSNEYDPDDDLEIVVSHGMYVVLHHGTMGINHIVEDGVVTTLASVNVTCVAFTVKGDKFLNDTEHGGVQLRDRSGAVITTYDIKGQVSSLAFNHTGKRFACSVDYDVVYIIDLETRNVTNYFHLFGGSEVKLSFSPVEDTLFMKSVDTELYEEFILFTSMKEGILKELVCTGVPKDIGDIIISYTSEYSRYKIPT